MERDGRQSPFIAGVLGILGLGMSLESARALQENPDFQYIMVRNEQATVHFANGYTKMKNRLQTFACTSSIGQGQPTWSPELPWQQSIVCPPKFSAAARGYFCRRNVAPVLQQLESPNTQDIGVNDCFKPVSRYWDRINRPEQLITSCLKLYGC